MISKDLQGIGKQLLGRITLFISVLLLSGPAGAENILSVQRENTVATLVSEHTGIVPGQPFSIGVFLEPKEGWHTYWENPGEAGLPTTLAWTLPEGFTASAIDWPVPEVITEGPLAVYGYKGPVLLPVVITPPALFSAASYPIKVKAEWLVCHEICVPESAELSMEVPVASSPIRSDNAPLFDGHREHRPIPLPQHVAFTGDAEHVTLLLPLASLGMDSAEGATFIARQSNFVRYAAAQRFSVEGGTARLTLEQSGDVLPEGSLSGLLVVTGGGEKKSFDITLATPVPATHPSDLPETPWLPLILFSALLGGLVLNLMPCVLPVLSLKALAIAKKAGHERYHVARQGMAYTFGILLSFGVIAGIMIGLQQGGEAVGWGYQMQSPAFVGFLIYLLFLVGLSLSGVFHLPVLLGNVGSRALADESSLKASFFTGVLATAVATPCTAPFMASAVGVALTLPPLESLLVFEALGLGLALPFLIISFFPACLRFIPKPGTWMNTFKHWLAVPMYASVVWLLWVLMMQTGTDGLFVAMGGLLILVGFIRMNRRGAFILLALLIALNLSILSRMETPGAMMPGESTTGGVATADYSMQALSTLRAEGKPVFVDATAAWCITCQVNARTSIHTERVMQAFRERGVTLMVADWTLRNPAITEFLRGFGAGGVPLYVYYPANGEPVVLPQILTETIVLDAISK